MDELPQPLAIWQTLFGWVLLAATALGAHVLRTRHFTQSAEAVPVLLLLACPPMRLCMHRGHGHRHCRGDEPPKPPS